MARALLGSPPLLMLDEPTSHLDPETADLVLDNLMDIEPRPTLLLVTHDPLVAERADRLVEVRGGQVEARRRAPSGAGDESRARRLAPHATAASAAAGVPLAGEKALAAWAEWRRDEPDLAKVEPGSLRLLPLLYRNLGAQQLAGDPAAAWLKDVYRGSWTANQLGLRVGRRAIDALQAAGIEVLALKGAALIGSVYGDLGRPSDGRCRPRGSAPQIGEAVRALQGAGLAAIEGDPERLLAARHSLAFRDPGGKEVDLHRGMLWHPGLDEEFWRGSVDAEVAGARVRILNPADQLLHVCAHGAAWNPVHPVRWAADAFKAIEAGVSGSTGSGW